MHKFCLSAYLFVAISSSVSIAQTTFQRSYGSPAAEFVEAVVQTNDGGYLLGGQTTSGAPDRDILLLKTDSLGMIEWSRAVGGSGEDRLFHAVMIAPDTVLLVGSTTSYGSGNADVWILEMTISGQIIWSKAYGGSSNDMAQFAEITSDGGFIIAGHTGISQDVLLLRLDRRGQLVWARRYGGQNTDVGMAVTRSPDGGFLIAGWTYTWGVYLHDALLLKTDSVGVIQWATTYGTFGDDGAHRILPTPSDGYVVLGNSTTIGGLFLMKIDLAGGFEWARGYQGVGEQILSSLAPTVDGGYVLSGSAGIYGAQLGYSYLMKTSADGALDWGWVFPLSKADLRVHEARQTADGGFVSAANLYRLSQEMPDILLVKTDAQGNTGCFHQQRLMPVVTVPTIYITYPTIPMDSPVLTTTEVFPIVRSIPVLDQDVCAVTELEEVSDLPRQPLLDNFPNPFNPSTTIRFTLPSSGSVLLRVYDMLGREVQVLIQGFQEAGRHDVLFDASGLAGGIYLCRLDANSTTMQKKIILLR